MLLLGLGSSNDIKTDYFLAKYYHNTLHHFPILTYFINYFNSLFILFEK